MKRKRDGKTYHGGRLVAKWERSSRQHHLLIGSTCLATITASMGEFTWSLGITTFTCGDAATLFNAKNDVAAELNRIRELQQQYDLVLANLPVAIGAKP